MQVKKNRLPRKNDEYTKTCMQIFMAALLSIAENWILPNVCQLMSGSATSGTFIQWDTTQQ